MLFWHPQEHRAQGAPTTIFGAILAATHGEKPSVVQICADDVSPDVIGAQVMVALRQMTVELETGALVILDPGRTRLRVLPLRSR